MSSSNIVSKTSVKIVSERRSKSKSDETKRLQNFKIGAIWVGTMSLVPKLLPKIGGDLVRHTNIVWLGSDLGTYRYSSKNEQQF